MSKNPNLAEKNITKFVVQKDIQVAFDLMTMKYHQQMMQTMKADMKYIEGATHGLMVTVLDKKTKNLIKHARVSITVEHPNRQIKQTETEIMSGAGMHHYAIHLNAITKGKYKVKANIAVRGKHYDPEVRFDLSDH